MVAPRAGHCRSMGAGWAVKSPGNRVSAMMGAWVFALGCFDVDGAVGCRDSNGDPASGLPAFCAAVSSAVGLVTSVFPQTCPKKARDCWLVMGSIDGQMVSQHHGSKGSRAVPGGTKGARVAGSCREGSSHVADGSANSCPDGALQGSGYGPRGCKSPYQMASLASCARGFPPWLPSLY